MNFESLKDQLLDQLQDIQTRIKESPLYNTLYERYQELSSGTQLLLIGSGLALVLFLLLSIPFSYLSSSSENIEFFESKRDLIRQLQKVASMGGGRFSFQNTITSFDQLKVQIEQRLQGIPLLDEQKKPVEPLDIQSLGLKKMAPAIVSLGAQISFQNLNLKELIAIGYELQNASPNIKLLGLQVHPGQKGDHYFNVTFKLASFSLKEEGKNSSRFSKKRSKRW
ncbi:MAG: hypothetical protein D6797_01030 [Bdellovibrio sp.]|nr:MAG: hypothetical protein D6797_01030 [Bdellovibrio sp.]